ncbi:hypothetical protein [Flagellimonas sp. S3867]|uniref:hypothetical protein n=1 Tax=Flagellimonas sp. S3867 TaxID=2768063 RepID=UPI001688E062|nr:hypothetical protein [Flagellimonas sp. S3867]
MNVPYRIKFTLLRLKPWTDFEKNPKEIFKDACNIIGVELSKYGYKYLKSKRLITGKSKNKDFTFQIFLNTTRFNETGRKVTMNVTCAIVSVRMGEYRNRHFKFDLSDNTITSFHPGYISKKNDWINWNLLKIHPLEIAHFLKKNAITVFDKFESPEKLIAEFNGILPKEFDFHFRAIDFLMFYSSKETTVKLLDSFLKEKNWTEEFHEILNLLKHGYKPEKKHRVLIVLLAERALIYELKN